MKYCFGDVVVVEHNYIGVIVKSWLGKVLNHDVYVRNFNSIKNYPEDEIERYMVRNKELSDEEIEYQFNAVNNQ